MQLKELTEIFMNMEPSRQLPINMTSFGIQGSRDSARSQGL
jgi:hypothetical protein